MKVEEIVSANPTCCMANDSTQRVANMMCHQNVGSTPVIADRQSRTLIGIDYRSRSLLFGFGARSGCEDDENPGIRLPHSGSLPRRRERRPL